MTKTIAELVIDLKVKAADAVKAEQVISKLKATGAKAQEALNTLGDKGRTALTAIRTGAERAKNSLEKIKGAAKIAGGALGAMSVGLGALLAAGGALVGFVQHIASSSDEVTKLAEATGVAAEDFERMSFAAKQSGAEVEHLSAGYRFFNKTLSDNVKSGTGPVYDSLTQLGIATSQLGGSMEDNLGIIGDALNKVQDPIERNILQARIFGEEAGPKLATLLAEGSKGIENLGNQAKIQGDTQRKSFTDFVNQMKTLQDSLGGLLADVLEPILPLITSLAEKFGGFFEGILASGLPQKLIGVLEVVLQVVFQLIEEVMPLFDELGKSGALDSIVQTLQILAPILIDIIKFTMPFLKLAITLLKPIVDTLNIILSVVGKLLDKITDLGDATMKWLNNLPMVGALKDGLGGLGDAIGRFSGKMSKAKDETDKLAGSLRNVINLQGIFNNLKETKLGKQVAGALGDLALKGEAIQEEKKLESRTQQKLARISELLEKGETGKKEGGKSGGLTETEVGELMALGVGEEQAKALQKKTGGGGGGKKEVTSDVDIGEALSAFRAGRGSAADLANVAKQLSSKTPETKDIKPTVAISFFNFDAKFNIKSTDPQKAAENVIAMIKSEFKKANARAGNTLSTNLVS